MEKIIMARGYGKTRQLVKQSGLNGDYIVCHSRSEAEQIMLIAKEMGYKIPFPITYDEFINKRYYGKGIKGFLIDNIEMFLQGLTDVRINAITMNP